MAAFILTGCGKHEKKESSSVSPDRREMAHKLILKSLKDLENKDLKSSVTSLEASIQVNPSDPEAYLLLSQILLNVGEYDKAATFLDQTSKRFSDNGTVFYMYSIASKMAGRKLPAVLAARRSTEIFHDAKDKENMLKSAMLLQDLINLPDAEFKAPGTVSSVTTMVAPSRDMKDK